jgi:hypothetical protein
MTSKVNTLLLLSFFIANPIVADKLEKGFERLKVHDYFNAKEYFEKSLDDETAGAAYGLALIFAKNNNAFFSFDSAHKYILLADSAINFTKARKLDDYAILGISRDSISSLSRQICEGAFTMYRKEDSVDGYDHFIQTFNTCAQTIEVISLRNAAAYNLARSVNTAAAYKDFLDKYPLSKEYTLATAQFEQKTFEEETSAKTINVYEAFIRNHPSHSYRRQAEKMIYELSVTPKTPEAYASFARNYPSSPFAEDAWRELYKLITANFSAEVYEKFKTDYPDYPFRNELETDYRLQNYNFLPVRKNNLFGYINENGEQMIAPAYEVALPFSEGLAVVSLNNKYGYINKAGKVIIPLKFSEAETFRNGAAIVVEDSLYGLIDRNGDYLIPPVYNELSEPSEDLCVAVRNDTAAYIYKNGKPLTQFIFDIAGDFKNGYAIVSIKEKFGVLNSSGSFSVEPQYDELVPAGSHRLKARKNGMWGLIDLNGEIILPCTYTAIGEYNEGLILIAKDQKCGFADLNGNTVVPLNFKYTAALLNTASFKNGYALIRQKLKNVIVDSTGKTISFPGIEDYGHPSEGLIPVRKNKKWGFAGMNGNILIPCKYQWVSEMNYGFAIVKLNNLTGMINSSGEFIITPLYENIISSREGIIVQTSGLFGLFSSSGIMMLACEYDAIEILPGGIARASSGESLTYANMVNNKIIFKGE